jgi:hypothetical protein
MQDLFVRTAVAQLGYNTANGSAWLAAHIDNAVLLANYSLQRRLAAVANASTAPPTARGLIFGSPEHDTCHEPDWYYHNNAWFIRGMRQMGAFLTNVCPTLCAAYAPLGAVLTAEAARFTADFEASLALTVTFDNATGAPLFIPPVARAGFAPFRSMIESTIAEYSNFRYYSELLGADVLSAQMRDALQNFRESTFGTVSGVSGCPCILRRPLLGAAGWRSTPSAMSCPPPPRGARREHHTLTPLSTLKTTTDHALVGSS